MFQFIVFFIIGVLELISFSPSVERKVTFQRIVQVGGGGHSTHTNTNSLRFTSSGCFELDKRYKQIGTVDCWNMDENVPPQLGVRFKLASK